MKNYQRNLLILNSNDSNLLRVNARNVVRAKEKNAQLFI